MASLKNHLDHCSVVLKHIQQSLLIRRLDVWGNKINIFQIIDHPSRLLTPVIRVRANWISPFYHGSELCFQGLKQSDPTNQERKYRLTSILHQKRWFLILLNCVKLMFVSCTSNLLEQTYDFQKCTLFLQKWISNLQDLPQKSESWKSQFALFCSFTHIAILFAFTCVMNVWNQIDSSVCHRPWSILWWFVQAYLLTIEYQVVKYVPNISISEQFESILVPILQHISFHLQSGGHRCMV